MAVDAPQATYYAQTAEIVGIFPHESGFRLVDSYSEGYVLQVIVAQERAVV